MNNFKPSSESEFLCTNAIEENRKKLENLMRQAHNISGPMLKNPIEDKNFAI